MKRCARLAIVGLVAAVAILAGQGYWHVALLWFELAGLDTAAPERDAAALLAKGRPVCYSVHSYPRYFPGLQTEGDRRYCQSIAKAFPGTPEGPFGEMHFRLAKEAARYASRFNRHVVSSRAPENR